jgi:alpha-L-fucosidase
MNLRDDAVLLPNFTDKIESVSLFDDGSKLKFKQDKFGTVINVPFEVRKEIDTIVVVKIK